MTIGRPALPCPAYLGSIEAFYYLALPAYLTDLHACSRLAENPEIHKPPLHSSHHYTLYYYEVSLSYWIPVLFWASPAHRQ